MNPADRLSNDYFEWIHDLVRGKRYSKNISYRKLLVALHSIEFRWMLPMDENRAQDGLDLRHRYTWLTDQEDMNPYFEGPCSVLEMMVALAIRCEESIMDDPNVGDRTGQWFWGMVVSLGLGSMSDSRFDRDYVKDVVERFLDREYEPNGKGGLFTIERCARDLRDVEIWYQLCWYLNGIN